MAETSKSVSSGIGTTMSDHRVTAAWSNHTLREKLNEIEAISNDAWLESLSERKRRELEFHDAHRDRNSEQHIDQDTYEKFYGNRKYYQATGPSRDYVSKWVAEHA